MTTPHARTPRRWSAAWGAVVAALISLFVFVPATFRLQAAMDVPEINPTPAAVRAHSPEVATSYWLTWAFTLSVLLAPALVLAIFPDSRRVAAGYAITAAVMGGLLAAAVINFELNGFAPD